MAKPGTTLLTPPSRAEAAATPQTSPKVRRLKTGKAGDAVTILDTVQGAYVRFDSEFSLTFVNRAAGAILGKSQAELLGRKLGDIPIAATGPSRQFADARWRRRRRSWNANTHQRMVCNDRLPDSSGGT
jgi:PAS domain-containing protein